MAEFSELQPNVQVNLAQVRAAMEMLKGKTEAQIVEAVNTTVEHAKENSPVGTPQSTGIPGYVGGTNKKSLTSDRENGGHRVYSQSGYGGWLEIGTTKVAARPHIMPGFTSAVKDLERALTGIA